MLTKILNNGSGAKGKSFMPPVLRSASLVSIGFAMALIFMHLPGLVTAQSSDDPTEPFALVVQAVAGEPTMLDVSWPNIEGNNGYLVQWKETDDDDYSATGNQHTTDADVTSYRITGLEPNTAYDVQVITKVLTDCTEVAITETWSGKTPIESVQIANLSVQAVEGSPSQLDVSWVTPVDQLVLGYMIQWKLESAADYSQTENAHFGSPDKATYRIGSLTPSTAYHVQVTQVGGDASDTSLSTTTAVSTNGWTTTWGIGPLDDVGIDVNWGSYPEATSFVVQWRDASTGSTETYSDTVRRTEVTDALTHNVSSLEAGKRYGLRVTAVKTENSVSTNLHQSDEILVFRYGWIDANLEPMEHEARGLNFAWTAEGEYAGYVLQWREVTETGKTITEFNDQQRVVISADQATSRGDLHLYDVESSGQAVILPNTLYQGQVTGYSEYASADAPDGDSATDSDYTFSEVTNLAVKPVPETYDQLNVTWKHGDAKGNWRNISGYRVRWKLSTAPDKDTPWKSQFVKGENVSSYRIKGLDGGSAYDVMLTATTGTLHQDADAAEVPGTIVPSHTFVMYMPSASDQVAKLRATVGNKKIAEAGLTVLEVDRGSTSAQAGPPEPRARLPRWYRIDGVEHDGRTWGGLRWLIDMLE